MNESDWLAERFEAHRAAPAGGRLPHARLGQRGRRRRAGGVAAPEPRRRRRGRQPRRLADHGGRPGLPRHAARARVAPRGAVGGWTARADRRRSTDAADPEQEALLADSVGLALLVVLDTLTPGRAARVRAARHVRRAVRRDRADRRAARPTRRASSPAAPGGGCRAPRRAEADLGAAARGRRRVPRRGARRPTSRRCSPCSTPTSSSRWIAARTAGSRSAASARRRAGHSERPHVRAARPPRGRQRRGRAHHRLAERPLGICSFLFEDDRIAEIDLVLDPEKLPGPLVTRSPTVNS